MVAQHIPGPYEAEAGGTGRGAWIGNAAGYWLCLTCGDTDEAARANTAFMLRAVNAHDDLVAALKQCKSELASLHHGDCDMGHAEKHSYGLRLANAILGKLEAL